MNSEFLHQFFQAAANLYGSIYVRDLWEIPQLHEEKTFHDNLKVEATQSEDRYGNKYECEHTGKCLNEFEFLNSHERFEVKYLGGEISGGPKRNERKLDELNEVGVRLSEEQIEILIMLINNFQNYSHLWCNRGWTPMELTRAMYHDGMPKAVSFGPGIEKVFCLMKLRKSSQLRVKKSWLDFLRVEKNILLTLMKVVNIIKLR